MILFNRAFEEQFTLEFERLKPQMSQEMCYGVSMSCIMNYNISPEKAAELRHIELLSYRTIDLWTLPCNASAQEQRLLFLYRLVYVLKEGWGAHIGIMQDMSTDFADDVIREIEWLLNDHNVCNIRLLTLDDNIANVLNGVGYMWHYQDWLDITDE